MISVIIPLYNVENYIWRCLQSFENQHFYDFELIVVNDGSTDKSACLVEEYAKTSKMNIKLIQQGNAGVSAARNAGFQHAAGRYVCFVDSDDMVSPNYLSALFDGIERTSADVALCGIELVGDAASPIRERQRQHDAVKCSSGNVLQRFLYRDIVLGIWSLLIKKEIMSENKIAFAAGYRYGEDIEVIYKIFSHVTDVACIKEPLYLYRMRPNSAMSLVDRKRLDGYKLMTYLENYLDKVRPDFAENYRAYGVARWVWATAWQVASGTERYSDFIGHMNEYNAALHMRKLHDFPRKVVALSALVYTYSPLVYYKIVRALSFVRGRSFTSS